MPVEWRVLNIQRRSVGGARSSPGRCRSRCRVGSSVGQAIVRLLAVMRGMGDSNVGWVITIIPYMNYLGND